MCRHRGNRVCRVDDGNAKRYMCTYHGCTYRNDGALVHVPGESEAYYDALDRPSLGLIEARVETYAGIVFATWPRTPRASRPIWATRAGISTPCSIGATAACRPWAR